MKDSIISVSLETSTAPIIKEVRGRDYIEYGAEDWRNLYPQFLIDLYYNSSTHAAIINATAEMIAGEDLIASDDDVNLDAYVKLKKFLRHANSKESLHQVIKKVAFDFKLQGAYALHVIWNRERTEISEVYHVPVERVRAGRPNEMGKVDTYFISADWSNTRTHKPYPIAAFNTHDRTAGSQLLYTGSYSPNMDIYHTPDYLASCNWALVDQRVAEFHLNNIENGFSGSYFISFANGVPTSEERRQIEQSLAEKFTGAKNSGKFVLTFSDDRTRTPEITPISVSDADKQYLALQELLVQNILTGHRVTSPMLMGIKNDTGLGSNVDELNSAFNFYLNTVIIPFQLNIKNTLQTLFSVNNMDLPVEFVQLKPITLEFTSEDLKGIMTEDELRSEMGLAPLDVEVREDFSKVEKTELESFIEEFGEDDPDGYTLLDEEMVEDEHEDFDFENELNEIYKVELATVPKSDRDGLDDQDGWSKKVSKFFKVRYKYDRDPALTNKSGTKREFCRKMMGANKLYKKSDLVALKDKVVNPGFGIKGAKKYNIWLYKGGPQCFHRFIRKVFVMDLEDAYNEKDITTYGKLISTAKARSQGFYPEPNNKKVAEAPRTMKNHGYYN
tara:strand:+ start:142 stop:1986 length:1845 start_codon:yes stop_codon:yes gene_type:complete